MFALCFSFCGAIFSLPPKTGGVESNQYRSSRLLSPSLLPSFSLSEHSLGIVSSVSVAMEGKVWFARFGHDDKELRGLVDESESELEVEVSLHPDRMDGYPNPNTCFIQIPQCLQIKHVRSPIPPMLMTHFACQMNSTTHPLSSAMYFTTNLWSLWYSLCHPVRFP
jgi:hypothetical protein